MLTPCAASQRPRAVVPAVRRWEGGGLEAEAAKGTSAC